MGQPAVVPMVPSFRNSSYELHPFCGESSSHCGCFPCSLRRGRIWLYSVYLDGFILFKVRYRDLHFWDEQMHRVFGNRLPKFPPKYFLAMTKPMADDRRLTLEKYLQTIVSDPVVSGSELFIAFFKKLQLETFKVPTRKLIITMFLPDGRQVKVDAQTSDTADIVLEAALYKLNVSRELMEYFCLFITHKASNGDFTVVKQIAHFEIPFITIWNINDERFQIGIRKRYMNPYTDAMLMGCIAAVDLLYAQAVQELEMKWCRPTEEQTEKLHNFIKIDNKVQFLELMQQVEDYGHLQLGPCTTNHPEADTAVTVSVGNNILRCSFQTPSHHTEVTRLPISKISCWHVTMLAQTEKPNRALEFKLQYVHGHSLKWITLWTNQAFLLSSCLEKILLEQPATLKKEELQIQAGIKTSSNTFTRTKHKWTAAPKKEDSFVSYVRESDVFEAEDFNL